MATPPSRGRQTVAKKAIRVVVEVAGKVFEFLADMIEKAVAALNWVWNKIKVMLHEFGQRCAS